MPKLVTASIDTQHYHQAGIPERPKMLRPNATRISLTRVEIKHLELKEGFRRFLCHGPVSIAQRPGEPTLGPGRDLPPIRNAGFRTRPPEPSSVADRFGSDESSSTQDARLSAPGHHHEPVPEDVLAYGRTQSSRSTPTVPRPACGLAEMSNQGTKASEDRSIAGGLTACARSLRTAKSAGSPGPSAESSLLDTNALHESNTQLLSQDVCYPQTSRTEYAPSSAIMPKQLRDGVSAIPEYQSASFPPAAAGEPIAQPVVSGTS